VKLTLWSAEEERPRGATRLHRDTLVQAPLDEVFGFFADAANLEQLTPPWLHFSIRTPLPVIMRAGLEIDYRISLYGVPFIWCSRIDVWEPGVRFVDRQIIGPYLWWRHEHRFERAGHDTRVIDDVEFLPRAAWMSARFVRHDVERIFNYRQAALQHIFPEQTRERRQHRQEQWGDSCSSTQSQ
jgi:ligand-binding SRPBCC domain-containing protein